MDITVPSHASNGKTTFIYALVDPNTKQIRYIGKSDNPRGRWYDHLADKAQTHKTHWIRSLSAQDQKPDLQIIEQVPIDLWIERERYWIAYYREAGCNLVNSTDGGDGVVNLPPESRERMRQGRLGYKASPETIEKMRKVFSGRVQSSEAIEKRVSKFRNKKRPPEVVEKIRQKHLGTKRSEQARISYSRSHTQLTPEQIAIIKFDVYGLLHREYADMFGISRAAVGCIMTGVTHKHITREHLPLSLYKQQSLWEPPKEYSRHNGRHPSEVRCKLTDEQAAIIKFNAYGLQQKQYAELFGVSEGVTNAITQGRTYVHITREHLPDGLQENPSTTRTRLTSEQAAIIKFDIYGLLQHEYAEMFEISEGTVGSIRLGKIRKNITREHLPEALREQYVEPKMIPGRDSKGRFSSQAQQESKQE